LFFQGDISQELFLNAYVTESTTFTAGCADSEGGAVDGASGVAAGVVAGAGGGALADVPGVLVSVELGWAGVLLQAKSPMQSSSASRIAVIFFIFYPILSNYIVTNQYLAL